MDIDIDCVVQRQNLFKSTLKSSFVRKITKYKNILLKNGVHLNEGIISENENACLKNSQSFEDHIELILGQQSESPNVRKTLWKIGSRVSTLKFFQWVFQVVQRTKAARILRHLDGISGEELEKTILSVGAEISVAYEYQLVMLDGDIEVIKLSQHASACMIAYLNSNDASFLPENLLQAILENKPQNNNNKDILKTRVMMYNNQPICLKWHLSQVLKQTGLRMFVKSTKEQNHFGHSLLNQSGGIEDEEGKQVKSVDPCTSNKSEDDVKGIIKPEIQDESSEKIDHETSNEVEIHETSLNSEEPSEYEDIASEHETSFSKPVGVRRKLNVVDMDFDNGMMIVTEQSVVASEFSAVDNTTSDFVDGFYGDTTSADEDLDSEIEPLPEISDEVVETVSAICEEKSSIDSENSKSLSSFEISHKQCDVLNDSTGSFDGKNSDNDINDDFCTSNRGIVNLSLQGTESKSMGSNVSDNKGDETVSLNNVCNVNHETITKNTSFKLECNSNGAIKGVNEMCNTSNIDINPTKISHCNNKAQQNGNDKNSNHSSPVNKNTINSPIKQLLEAQSVTLHINTSHQNDVNYNQFNSLSSYSNIVSNNPIIDQTGSRDLHINHSNNISKVNQSATQDLHSDTSKTNISCSSENSYKSGPDTASHISVADLKSAETLGNYKFYGCFTPFGAKCRPEIYGFRGPLHVWNEKEKAYTLIYNDMVSVKKKHDREIERNYCDYHQSYIPKTSCCHKDKNI